MNEQQTESGSDAPDLEQFRERAKAWLAEVTLPDVPDDEDERFEVLRDWQRTLYEAGWLGISWSRLAGGGGLSTQHQLVFAEESARARAPQPVGLIGLEVVGATIDSFGTEEQRRSLIPPLLSGEHIWCQGFSEPGAGSDLASLKTRARIEGDEFVISGQKVWTSYAHKADWCALLVRTDPDAPKHKGISYVLVDMRTSGITARPITQMTGDSEFCEVFFDEVRVPMTNLIGELNQGWAIANDTLAHERGGATLRNRVELEVLLREASGDLAAHFAEVGEEAPENVCRSIGKSAMAVRALEAQSRFTARRIAENDVPSPYDSVDKMTVSWVEQLLAQSVTDLVGPFRAVASATHLGLGSSAWHKFHLYSRASSIYGGSNQVQKNIISKRLLRLPIE